MKYKEELDRAMEWLATKSNTVFMGQAIGFSGHAISNTMTKVPQDKRIELPVFEELQMGIATGMALEGWVPVTCYPRFDFFILGLNQLVNHLDKIKIMSGGGYQPKVIIRTSIGAQRPLHPQHQHIADFTGGFKAMCDTVDIIRLDEPHQIFESFQYAYERTDGRSTILVEWGDYYGEK